MRAKQQSETLVPLPTLDRTSWISAIRRSTEFTRTVGSLLVFSGAFLLAYLYGQSFSPTKGAPLWPPDAILLSALLLTPRRRWWLYLLVPLPIRLLVAVPASAQLWVLLAYHLNDALKAVAGAVLLQRLSRRTVKLSSMRELLQFFGVAVVLTPMLSALAGALTRHAFDGRYWTVCREWFLGDALASLILTPMVLYWSTGGLSAVRGASNWRRVEGVVLFAGLMLIGFEALSGDPAGIASSAVLIYLPFPLLLYAAVRFGPLGISTALSLIAALAIWNADQGLGPFVAHSPAEEILSLQLFLAVVSIPLLCVAVLLRERQRAAASLRETTEQLARTETFSLVMVTNIGLDGRWLKVPPTLCEMLGYTEEELLSAHFRDVTHPDDFETEWSKCQRLVNGEARTFGLEKRFVHKDGHAIWTYLNSSVVTDADGRPLHLLTYIRDISERRAAEEMVKRLNAELETRVAQRTRALDSKTRELERFAYSVAHDLKAPLRGISGYSELLLTDYAAGLDDEGRRVLGTIVSTGEQMSQLIDDLLEYARVERRDVHPARLSLGALITPLVEQKKRESGGRAIDFVINLKCDTVVADERGLIQALANYLDNAVKFTRNVASPRIEVGAEDTEAARVLWVRDNGIGFDMTYHERIFQMFQRLGRDEDYAGTGVGLAIVRKTMERLGGRAWAESRPGHGATFYLEIPDMGDSLNDG